MMRRSSLLDRKLNTSRALRWPAELTGQGFVFARRNKVNNTYVKYYWLLFKDNSCETLTAVNILCKHVVEKLPSPNPESVTCDGENKRKPSYMSNTHQEIPMENFFFFNWIGKSLFLTPSNGSEITGSHDAKEYRKSDEHQRRQKYCSMDSDGIHLSDGIRLSQSKSTGVHPCLSELPEPSHWKTFALRKNHQMYNHSAKGLDLMNFALKFPCYLT